MPKITNICVQRTENYLPTKQKQLEKKLRAEQEVLDSIQTRVSDLQKELNNRIKLLNGNKTDFTSRKELRGHILKVLGFTKEKFESESTKENMTVNPLRSIECLIRLVNSNISLVDSEVSGNSIKQLQVILDSLEGLYSKIESDRKLNEKEFDIHQNRENIIVKCNEIFSTLQNSKEYFDSITKLEELTKILKPEIDSDTAIFSRDIPIHQSNSQEKQEETNIGGTELLDQVILSTDPEIKYIYQLTYKYFTTPQELLTQLCVRYCLTPERETENGLITKYQRNVLQFLRSWIRNFYEVDIKGPFAEEIKEFIALVVAPSGL